MTIRECCICLDPLEGRRHALVAIPCGPHTFHYACYHQWRSKTNVCPLCRNPDETIPFVPVMEEDDSDNRCYAAMSMGTYAAFAWITGILVGAYGCL